MKHIVLCCATNRGLEFLKNAQSQASELNYTLSVFTFKEGSDEPPFTQNIVDYCNDNKIPVYVTRKIENVQDFWNGEFDVLFCVGWRYLIPKKIYEKAKIGSFVFHDSLLPKYRGFAPTVRALINGEEYLGVSLIKMTDEVDAGDIISQGKFWVGNHKYTIAQVIPEITKIYLSIFNNWIKTILNDRINSREQEHDKATYSPKMMPEDYEIEWNSSIQTIDRLIRATTYPYPRAYTTLKGHVIRIAKAEEIDDMYMADKPGRVVKYNDDGSFDVLTINGTLRVLEHDLKADNQKALLLNQTLGK